MKELEKAKEIFLSDVDEETRDENIELLNEWEVNIAKNQAYLEWKDSDITIEINKIVREAYKEHALLLATNRSLTEEQRQALYAKQDACLFILSLTNRNAKTELDSIIKEIQHAINATNQA